MSKAKDAMRYALDNEERFRRMSGAQQLGELKALRAARAKLATAQAKAEVALEQVDEYQAVMGAKAAVKLMEAHIEGTLMLIDRGQGELPIGQVLDAMVGTMPMVDRETGEVLGAMPRRRGEG